VGGWQEAVHVYFAFCAYVDFAGRYSWDIEAQASAGNIAGAIRLAEDIQRPCSTIDDRRGRDADLGPDERALNSHGGYGCHARSSNGTHLPEWRGRLSVGIKRNDAVMLGGKEDRVVLALAGDIHSRQVQRLGVDIAIDFGG